MKIITWFFGLIVIAAAGIYFMLFSAIGNAILAPIVEGKIQEQTQLDSKLKVFSLSMNEFEVLLELNQDNTVFAKGSYSLFEQSFDTVYDVKFNKLETLEPLTKKPLKGPLFTDGTAKGNMAFMKIDNRLKKIEEALFKISSV